MTTRIVELIQNKKFIVCVGSGGVGKTTVSAAIGLLAACMGKKTLVVTIDPAKRLANALGMTTLSSAPQQVAHSPLLSAMMLDLTVAWNDLVQRLCDEPELYARILQNRFYGYLSKDLAGSQEFVACEALYTLATEHQYDLIVLDTPPTVHALDFLDAPSRILGFLDQDAFRFFIREKQSASRLLGIRLFDKASLLAKTILSKFVAGTFVQELTEFVHLLADLYPPLIRRTRAFQELLAGPDATFAVVMAPREISLSEGTQIYQELQKRTLPFGAFIVNRMQPVLPPSLLALKKKAVAKKVDALGAKADATAAALLKARDAHQAEALRDSERIQRFLHDTGNTQAVIRLPLLAYDVYDASSLNALLGPLSGEANS